LEKSLILIDRERNALRAYCERYLDRVQENQYLLTRHPFIILLVVLADIDKLRALEITDFDSSRISTRGKLEESASSRP